MEKFPDIPHPPCQPLPPGVNCAASKGVVVGVDRSALFCFQCGGGKGGAKTCVSEEKAYVMTESVDTTG